MKIIVLNIIALLIVTIGFSQSFPLKSSKWYYANAGGTMPPNTTLTIYGYEKDTIINDTLGRKLNNDLVFYSRNDSVFYYNVEQYKFELIYDFSANEGDTIELCAPSSELSDLKSFKVIIDAINDEEYDGVTLKKYHTISINSDFRFEKDFYMERIGAIYFLPVFGYSIPESDYLKCYEDSSILINYSNIPCDSLIGNLIHINERGDLVIHSDPENGIIEIQSIGKEELVIELSDISGRLVYSKRHDLDKTIIDISSLETGIYLIRVRLRDKLIATEKIIMK